MRLATGIGIGIQFSRGGGQSWETYWIEPTEKAFAVLDSLSNSRYNWYVSLDHHPNNMNKILMTWVDGDSHIATHDCQIKMRVSNDNGQSFGAASVLYHPADTNKIIMSHFSGYSSDGRWHILIVLLDNVSGANSLLYLYSDNYGTSFTETDISALVADANHPVYRLSSHLIENDGVMICGFYRQKADTTETVKSALRLVAGTWTRVDIETTVTYENETMIAALDSTHLIALARAEVARNYVQYASDDNGLTWTRLGSTDFGAPAASTSASFGSFSKFKMQGEDIIEFNFPRRSTNGILYAIYGKASDLIEYGLSGWHYGTLRSIWDCDPSDLGYTIQTGQTLHYNNNYNAIGFWAQNVSLTVGNIFLFEIDTTDVATLEAKLFPTITDSDVIAFNTAVGLSVEQQSAINTLVVGYKASGIWTKYKAIYPMIGGTAEKHKWNLKDPRDLDAAFRLTFVDGAGTGWLHSTTGAKPDGTGTYANTHLSPLNDLTLYNAGLGFYSRTDVASDTACDFGAIHLAAPEYYGLILMLRLSTAPGFRFFSNGQGDASNRVTINNADSRGYFKGTRRANNDAEIYINGVPKGANTFVCYNSITSNNLYLCARNGDGTAAIFSPRECAFADVDTGLTDDDVAASYTLIQAFQTTLRRNV